MRDGLHPGAHPCQKAGPVPAREQERVVSNQWADSLDIERAIRGDRDAMDRVWRRVRRWVGAVVLAHKPREADLEDLMQQVALKLCSSITDVRDPGAFKPWLRSVAINTARAEGRKTTRRRAGFLRFVSSSAPNLDSASRDPELSEHARRVLDAARRLPENYRDPVVMRCLHEMSYREIGEVMGLPETTVETRIARGRRMLRETLRQMDEQEEARRDSVAAALTGGAP